MKPQNILPETLPISELPLITKDETLRLQCLSLSVQSFEPMKTYTEELPIIQRARRFEQYVRNGEI